MGWDDKMVMWRIRRLVYVPIDQQTEECEFANNVADVTMFDDDTHAESTVRVCWDPTLDVCQDPGGLLWNLNGSGFAPADWDAECPFE